MVNNSKGMNVIVIERVLSQVTATSVRRWYRVKRRRPRCAVPTSDPHVIRAEQSLFLTHTACHYKMRQFCSKADLFQAKEAVPNCSTTDLVVKRKEAWRVICWLNTSAGSGTHRLCSEVNTYYFTGQASTWLLPSSSGEKRLGGKQKFTSINIIHDTY